jgi:hypothetical protein
MSLSECVPRRHMHTRQTRSDGYRRADGLWDIESSIVDVKSYPYHEPARGLREPGSEVHHMQFRLTVDDAMVVRSLEVVMLSGPYPSCSNALARYQHLVGRSVAQGWRRAVQEVAGGNRGCTHISELLVSAGSAVVQTLHGWPEETPDGSPARLMQPRQLDKLIDSCSGLAAGGEGAAHVLSYFQKCGRSGDFDIAR